MKPFLPAFVLGCLGWTLAIWADSPTPRASPADGQGAASTYIPVPRTAPVDEVSDYSTNLAELLESKPSLEDAKAAAFKMVQDYPGSVSRFKLLKEVEKRLTGDPDSQALNLMMAALTHEGYPQHFRTDNYQLPKLKPPLWLRLTCKGGGVQTWYSKDGEEWTILDNRRVPLGEHPLAGLPIIDPPLAYNKVLTPNVHAVVDQITLSPATETPQPPDGSLLPAPWVEVELPPRPKDTLTVVREKTVTPGPSSARSDGTFVLHANEGDLTPSGDAGRLVYRPLDDPQSFSARIVSFDANSEGFTGLMLRASTDADAPFAAILTDGKGGVLSRYRLGEHASLKYWRKLAALRQDDRTAQLALAEELSWCGYRAKAIAVYDALIGKDPAWLFESQGYEMRRIFDEEAAPQLGERLLAWRPPGLPSEDEKHRLAGVFESAATGCEKQGRYDLVATLCQRGLELYDNPWLFSRDRTGERLHPMLFRALIKLDRRDEACEELLSRLVPRPPQPGVTKSADDEYQYRGWMSYSYNSNGIYFHALSELETAREYALLPGLEVALRARMQQPDAQRQRDAGVEWLLALVRIYQHDPAVLKEIPALFSGQTGKIKNMRGHGEFSSDILRLVVGQQLQRWPGQERLALGAFLSATRLLAAARQGGGDHAEFDAGLQMARSQIQLGDEVGATNTLAAVMQGVSAEGTVMRNNPPTSKLCMALLLKLNNPVADQTFLKVLDHVREATQGKECGAEYEPEKQLRLGNVSQFGARTWLLDPGSNEPDPKLVFELQPRSFEELRKTASLLEAHGRSFPAMLVERKIRFEYGREAGHLQPLGELKTMATFGPWQVPGPLPMEAGFLKAVIDVPPSISWWTTPVKIDKESLAASSVLRSTNLMVNPDFAGLAERDSNAETFALAGWKELPRGFWLPGRFNCPLPGKSFMQCELSNDRQERTIRGERIPLHKGSAYLQSGWLREEGGDNSRVRFGRSYLDANGKVLKTSECPDPGSLVWRRVGQRLQPTGQASGSDQGVEAIPPDAVFIEPYLKCIGAVEWTGLFIGQTE